MPERWRSCVPSKRAAWRGRRSSLPNRRLGPHGLWSSGELAIRERRRFHRHFDLAERLSTRRAVRELPTRALSIHGWAERRTLAGAWRLGPHRKEVESKPPSATRRAVGSALERHATSLSLSLSRPSSLR